GGVRAERRERRRVRLDPVGEVDRHGGLPRRETGGRGIALTTRRVAVVVGAEAHDAAVDDRILSRDLAHQCKQGDGVAPPLCGRDLRERLIHETSTARGIARTPWAYRPRTVARRRRGSRRTRGGCVATTRACGRLHPP